MRSPHGPAGGALSSPGQRFPPRNPDRALIGGTYEREGRSAFPGHVRPYLPPAPSPKDSTDGTALIPPGIPTPPGKTLNSPQWLPLNHCDLRLSHVPLGRTCGNPTRARPQPPPEPRGEDGQRPAVARALDHDLPAHDLPAMETALSYGHSEPMAAEPRGRPRPTRRSPSSTDRVHRRTARHGGRPAQTPANRTTGARPVAAQGAERPRGKTGPEATKRGRERRERGWGGFPQGRSHGAEGRPRPLWACGTRRAMSGPGDERSAEDGRQRGRVKP